VEFGAHDVAVGGEGPEDGTADAHGNAHGVERTLLG
jgi:hypothetical protein